MFTYDSDNYLVEYDNHVQLTVITEKSTGRKRSIQGEEAIEFNDRIDNYDAETAAALDAFVDDECSNHFLEDNEDDYERGLV